VGGYRLHQSSWVVVSSCKIRKPVTQRPARSKRLIWRPIDRNECGTDAVLSANGDRGADLLASAGLSQAKSPVSLAFSTFLLWPVGWQNLSANCQGCRGVRFWSLYAQTHCQSSTVSAGFRYFPVFRVFFLFGLVAFDGTHAKTSGSWQCSPWQNLSVNCQGLAPFLHSCFPAVFPLMSSGVVSCLVSSRFSVVCGSAAGQLATAEGPRTDCMWSATCWPNGSLWR